MGKQILIQKILGANGNENIKNNAFASQLALALLSSLPYSLYIEKKTINWLLQHPLPKRALDFFGWGAGGEESLTAALRANWKSLSPLWNPLMSQWSDQKAPIFCGVLFYGR